MTILIVVKSKLLTTNEPFLAIGIFCSMNGLKILFNFYLDASIHVALSVISLAAITSVLLNIPVNLFLIGFIFFSTIVCYNFVKYGVEAEKYLIVSNVYHKNIQVFSFISFLLAIYFLANLDRKIWLVVAGLGLISTLYAIPFLPKAKNLRSLGGFKIYVVAVVWVGFTSLLPVLDFKMPLTYDLWVLFAQRFILVLILILPFEIRDLQWDDKKLKTLPQVLGIQKTKMIGFVLIALFCLLTFLRDEVAPLEIIMRLFLGSLLMAVFLLNNTFKTNYLVSFWIEGIPILWFGVFYGLETFF